MNSRENILNRLKEASNSCKNDSTVGALKDPVSGDPDLFMQKAAAAGAQVTKVPNLALARERLFSLLQDQSCRSIITSSEPIIKELDLTKFKEGTNLECYANTDLPAAKYRTYVQKADMGISACDYAVADTGSVVICHSHGNERLISLAPSRYICLVRGEQILADRFSLTSAIHRDFSNSLPVITIITGVSRTADVAMQTVLGMHGPRQVDIIVIG